MKPTVIGGNKPEPTTIGVKPTVIASRPAPVEEKHVKPTTWTSTAPAPTPAPTPAPVRPAKIPGIERSSMKISKDQLSKRFISYDDAILSLTQQILGEVTLDIFDTQTCLSFGTVIQQRYGQSVDKWLKVLEGDQVRTSARHIQRLKEVLQSIVESLAAGHQNWFKRETIQEKFDKAKPEIEQLRKILISGEQQLGSAHRELAELKVSTQRLIREATGFMLACEFLADLVADEKSKFLVERGMSLAKTVGLLQTQSLKLEQDEQTITALVTQIQDGVLVALPAMLSTIATAVQDEKNDTQRFVVRDQLMDIIRKLS